MYHFKINRLSRPLWKIFKRSVSDLQELKEETKIKKATAIEKFKQQSGVRVTILGACTPTGEALSLLLKANPLISHLYLQGEKAKPVARELSHIDTRTMVYGYNEKDLDKAVRCAEIIVILGVNTHGDRQMKIEDKFHNEYDRLINITRLCTMYAPKAILYICVPPVSMTVPLVAGIYKKTHWYNPAKIIGSVAFFQMSINATLARYEDLDPAGVHVPLVGGPEQDCIVPLFSRAKPLGCSGDEAEFVTKVLRDIPEEDPVTLPLKKMEFPDYSPYAHAFALNRSVSTMALAILGDQNALMAGFIRSNILPTCKHLTATLRMGPGGVFHNYGIPLLTPTELYLMEQAALMLDERENKALAMLDRVDDKKVSVSQ